MLAIALLAIAIAAWLEPVLASGYRRAVGLLVRRGVRTVRTPVPALQAMSERSS